MRWDLLKKSLRWLGWTVLVLLVVFVGLNAFDRDLSETAKSMARVPENPYPPEKICMLR